MNDESTDITINLCPTERGFQRGEFLDLYGAECSIQESSMATADALWLGVDRTQDAKELSGIRMHLTPAHVRALLPYLIRFAVHGDLSPLEDEKAAAKICKEAVREAR